LPETAKPASISTTPVAPGLDDAGGWVGMEVQFLVDHASGADSFVLGRTVFAPGDATHALHRHLHAEEAVLILQGHGVAVNGGEEVEVGPGDVVFHPRGEWHGFRNSSPDEPVEMLWVWGGAASRDTAGYELFDGGRAVES
jgi:mannose-6-phosphate isomerase-like protein (cupin superfamily)